MTEFDFRKRCYTTKISPGGLTFDVIRYGVTAAEWRGVAIDMTSPFVEFGKGRTTPIELEKSRHFFNKRIMLHGETIQGSGDKSGVGAQHREGGASGTAEIEAAEGGSGSGGEGEGELTT